MPDFITREEFDMYVKTQDAATKRIENGLTDILNSQNKTQAIVSDYKVLRVQDVTNVANMKKDIAYIKSDKLWLNRTIVGSMICMGLAGFFKFLWG